MNGMMWRSCAGGLLTVIVIGLIVEKLIFRTIEQQGTQS